ncbi:MAG: class F sortase [Oscillospiraceae bacterium]|nr:class F sortase [Oscillospiraceae bacterium]
MHILSQKQHRSIFKRTKRSLYLAYKKIATSSAAIKELSTQEDDAVNQEASVSINETVEKKGMSKALKTVLLITSSLLLVIGIIISVSQSVYIPNHSYIPPAVIVDAPTPQDTVAPSASVEVLPTPFIKVAPVRLYFIKRNISCDIEKVGKTETGAMATVDDPYIAAWYEDGPSPGDKGNALVNGHVRWGGIAGTFSILSEMAIGEEIVFEYENGTQKSFYVSEIVFYPFNDVPSDVMSQNGEDRVTLISCYGKWDSEAGTSSERVFVICKTEKGLS